MSRLTLTFEATDLADLIAQLRLTLALLDGNRAPGGLDPPAAPWVERNPPRTSAQAMSGAPDCVNGHGAMVWREGGTTKAGPRIGQPYPPFWTCPACKSTQEVTDR